MFSLFKNELKKYIIEVISYYPDFIVGIIINFIMFILVFLDNNVENSYYIGYIFWILSNSVLGEAALTISIEKQSGLLKNLLIKPYSIVTIMTFKTISWFLINLIKLIIIISLIKLFFTIKLIINIYVIMVIIITMISIYGFSLILMGLTIVYTKTASFESIIGFIFLFLSNNKILIEKLPKDISKFFEYFPYILGINISEEIIFKGIIDYNKIFILLFLSILYLFIGYIVFKYVIKNSQQYSSKY